MYTSTVNLSDFLVVIPCLVVLLVAALIAGGLFLIAMHSANNLPSGPRHSSEDRSRYP